MFSIFALPKEEEDRARMLEIALSRGNIIHFVNEHLQLITADDRTNINKYLEFSRYGKPTAATPHGADA